MPVESLFPRLEPLLAQVQKPIQYVGGELNSTVKDWDSCDVRWALMYPDAYEVGVPNQGVMILYEVLNEQPRGRWPSGRTRCGRTWRPSMREHGLPAFTVDAHRPVGAFDLLGVSFATELGYTNLLQTLDLAGIPRRSADRTEEHPVVLAGGHAAFNPEPVADFVDAAVLGDGEQAVLQITDVVRALEARGPPGRSRRAAAAPGPHRRCLRPGALRRRLPARRAHQAGGAQPARRAVAGRQAHGDGPRRVAVPQEAAGPARRVGARARVGGDLPRLHARLPLLPGGHDHPPGARALDHRRRRDGREEPGGHRLRGGRAAVAVQRRPQRDRPDDQGAGRPLRGDADLAVAALHAGRRVQHRPGQRADPQRPAHRPDVRARGRQRAHPQGDQQDGHRGGPDPHGHRGVLGGLAAGEALLHVRAAHRDRRRRAADRRPGQEGHRDRAARSPGATTSAAPCRSAGSSPSRTRRSSGSRSSATTRPTRGWPSCATRCARTGSSPRRSASATTTASPASSKDCCPAATAGSARSSRRSARTAAASTAGASTSPSSAG